MDETERRSALADFLRTRRARLQPEQVGLPARGRRRTPGLRREEVAELASIGVSWYTLLEQGQDVHPSPQVLDSLAGALRLTAAERQHLFLLAGQAEPLAGSPAREEITPALRRMVDALDPNPVYVMGRRWDLLAWNQAAEAIFKFSTIAAPHTCNLIWRVFTTPSLMEPRVVWERIAKRFVARFRADSARYPGDPWFAELIADLGQTDTPFRTWWARHDVRDMSEGHKETDHPTLGRLEFEHITLQVPTNPDVRVVIYSPSADTAPKLGQLLELSTGD